MKINARLSEIRAQIQELQAEEAKLILERTKNWHEKHDTVKLKTDKRTHKYTHPNTISRSQLIRRKTKKRIYVKKTRTN